MREIKEITSQIFDELNVIKATKASFSVAQNEKKEFNVEGRQFTLMRTLFDNNISVNVWDGAKKGSASGNDLSKEAVSDVVKTAYTSAQSAPDDPDFDIAPAQDKQTFRDGALTPDIDKLYERTNEMLETISREYPQIMIYQCVVEYINSHSIYCNTNGTEFETYEGQYDIILNFSANDGQRNTGIDGTVVVSDNLDKPFIECGDIRTHLENCVAQLNEVPFSGKFEGTVVFTPGCLHQMISYMVMNFMSDSVLIDDTSIWCDKLGEKVASDKLTITSKPRDSRIVCGPHYNGDGFPADDVVYLEKGVLRKFNIGLYTANKKKLEPVQGCFQSIVIDNGDVPFADIIKSVKRGLLVGDFSGGTPSANGEISGVAKSSFLIEDGVIKGAVSETMINGNLAEMFNNIVAVSKETVDNGMCVMPYMAIDKMVISGK